MRPGSFASDGLHEDLLGLREVVRGASRGARAGAPRGRTGRRGPPRRAGTRATAASGSSSFSSVAPRLKRTRAKNAAVPGASSFRRTGFFLRAGSVSRIERNAAAASANRPREPRTRPSSKRAPQRCGGVGAGLRAAVALGEQALGEVEVALRLRGLDEERKEAVGHVLRLASADLAREDDGRRVVAPRLAAGSPRAAPRRPRGRPTARAPRRGGPRGAAAPAGPPGDARRRGAAAPPRRGASRARRA